MISSIKRKNRNMTIGFDNKIYLYYRCLHTHIQICVRVTKWLKLHHVYWQGEYIYQYVMHSQWHVLIMADYWHSNISINESNTKICWQNLPLLIMIYMHMWTPHQSLNAILYKTILFYFLNWLAFLSLNCIC